MVDHCLSERPEYERRLRGLEEKINTLIVENDQVLGENAHLRTIIAKNFNTVEQNFDVLRSYDSEHQELQIKIEELLRDNSELKKQINGLTENVYQLKKKGSSKEVDINLSRYRTDTAIPTQIQLIIH